jgi:hypothetical protein
LNVEKKEIVIRNKVNELKTATLASDRQLCKRFKKSLYWVRKSTGRENRKNIEGRRIRSERVPFKKIRGRAAAVIKQIIKECQAPLQIPYLLQTLKENHGILLSGT